MGIVVVALIIAVLILYNSPNATAAYNFLHSNNPVLITVLFLILIALIGLAIKLRR